MGETELTAYMRAIPVPDVETGIYQRGRCRGEADSVSERESGVASVPL